MAKKRVVGVRVPLVDRKCSTCGTTYRASALARLCRECGAEQK